MPSHDSVLRLARQLNCEAMVQVADLESIKARAHDALSRGHLNEAERLYEGLEEAYAHHGFTHGRLAIRFNRLLIALELGDCRRVNAGLRVLAELLESIEPSETQLVQDAAAALGRLFADPVPGVEAELAARLLSASQPHVHTASTHGEASATLLNAEIFAGLSLTPAHIAHLHPDDAALLLATWATRTDHADSHVSAAAAAIARRWLAQSPRCARVTDPLESYRKSSETKDPFQAYKALVDAYDRACASCPSLAPELNIGAAAMEDAGLPERVEFAAGLPRERRLANAVDMHADLGEILVREPGWEDVAMAQWDRALTQSDAWLERVAIRQSRGGGRAVDAELTAHISIVRSRALRIRGELHEASAVLDPVVGLAQVGAYTRRHTTAKALLEAADIAERRARSEQANALFSEAASTACPGILGLHDLERRAAHVDKAVAQGRADDILLACRALAGVVRTAPDPDPLTVGLDEARTYMALARPYVSPSAQAYSQLAVELTAARIGERDAADRALEAARALHHQPATALAMLYRALGMFDQAGEDPSARARALTELTKAAGEARLCPKGAVRRTIEIVVAVCHLSFGADTDPARVDIHLRRAAEGSCPFRQDGAGDLDVFLPPDRRFTLAHTLRGLLDAGRAESARRLCAVERQRGLAAGRQSHVGPLAERIRMYHRRRFNERWGLARHRPDLDEDALEALAAYDDPRSWAHREPAADEAQLEFHLFDDFCAVFAARHDGCHVIRLQISRKELQSRVADCLRYLRSDGSFSKELRTAARSLHSLLIQPLGDALAGARRVLVAPDGPLVALPFGILLGESWLAEQYDLGVAWPTGPTPAPPRSNAAPPAVLIVGDAVTADELRLSTLAAEGCYANVDVRHGGDLAPDAILQTIGPAHLVHLVGAITDGPCFLLRDDGSPIKAEHLGMALHRGGVRCATLHGPVEGPVGRDAIAHILRGVTAGVVARHWHVADASDMMLQLVREVADVETPQQLVSALGAVRRKAIEAGTSPRVWAGHEVYVQAAP